MLSTNVAKAIRIDFLKTCPNGSAGKRLYDIMIQRFSRVQEPPPAKMNKPLARPDDKPSRKRGGEKYRKMKEKKGLTNIGKLSQRMKFGEEVNQIINLVELKLIDYLYKQAEEEFRDTGRGFGLLGVGIGSVKMNVNKNQKVKLSKLYFLFNEDIVSIKIIIFEKQLKNN